MKTLYEVCICRCSWGTSLIQISICQFVYFRDRMFWINSIHCFYASFQKLYHFTALYFVCLSYFFYFFYFWVDIVVKFITKIISPRKEKLLQKFEYSNVTLFYLFAFCCICMKLSFFLQQLIYCHIIWYSKNFVHIVVTYGLTHW